MWFILLPFFYTSGCNPHSLARSVLHVPQSMFSYRLRCNIQQVLTVVCSSPLQGQVCALQKGHNCATLMSTPCMTWWPAPGAANGVMCSDCRTKFGESDTQAQRRGCLPLACGTSVSAFVPRGHSGMSRQAAVAAQRAVNKN